MTAVDLPVIMVDLFGTLLHDPWRESLEAATGRSLAEVIATRPAGLMEQLEVSAITEGQFWQAHRDAGLTVDPAAFHATRAGGYRWLPGAEALLGELVEQHPGRVVIASNYPAAWISGPFARFLNWTGAPLFCSDHLGHRKPDDQFFLAVARAVDVPAARLALIDDSAANVAGLLRIGGVGHVFTGAPETRRWLAGRGLVQLRERTA